MNSQDRRRPLRVVVNPASDSLIMQEEIFGPALVVLSYDDLDQVITEINGRPRPLALYYFGEDAREQRHVLEHTLSGGVTLNEVMMHAALHDAPFGGLAHPEWAITTAAKVSSNSAICARCSRLQLMIHVASGACCRPMASTIWRPCWPA